MDPPLERCCVACGDAFVLGEGERTFFARKGLALPRRCPSCREARRPAAARPPVPPSAPDPRDAVCSACGALTRLKFEPTDARPVYCDPCFRNR